MKPYLFICLLSVASVGTAYAETSTMNPIGFNKVVCLTNSDTIVGVPFRMQGSMRDLVAGSPAAVPGEPDLMEIPLQALNLSPDSLDTHYLMFDGGTRDGRWYDITANTATSVTIDLNGDDLDGVGNGNPVIITEYWTLDTLFPPDQATTSWTADPESGEMIQNGHAIVASSNTSLRTRRTQVYISDSVSDGINFSAVETFYITNGQWYDARNNQPLDLDFVLMPDQYFTISHPATVSAPTVYRSAGEVASSDFTIPLRAITTGAQDNYVAIPRPIDLRLDQLNLYESGAFVASSSTSLRNRKDELLVFDNEVALRNRSASAIFYHNGVTWLNAANHNVASDYVIPAAAGFVIRKARVNVRSTSFWQNIPTYD